MKIIGFIFCCFLLVPPQLFAKSDIQMGPVIEGYGPTSAITDADVKLPEGFIYKALFDISETNKKHDQYNRKIESVARFLNMHARNGVKIEDMKLAVVLHGAATKDVLNDEAYAKRHGHNNPNTDLIKELSEKGVSFYICGQSAAFYDIKKSELSTDVKLALSAMTMAVLLQQEGYQLIPF
ncbi:DsrE family protein [Kangiella aquimarina]|uniref:DsrE family protein n=1 Tax=Kangiella aquimarina TaxID=261965 RepID=A0ABZ0X2F0_9GAMM|nr:DsrE family protein [Kangiella aquimarina]WQG84756.1 DsrE family protein [Kangiella aquimarina]